MADFAFRGPTGKRISHDKWQEYHESRIGDEQHEQIKKKYGKDVANKANYGWGVSEDKGYKSVATKVYPDGKRLKKAKVLVSEAVHPHNDHDHRWDEY